MCGETFGVCLRMQKGCSIEKKRPKKREHGPPPPPPPPPPMPPIPLSFPPFASRAGRKGGGESHQSVQKSVRKEGPKRREGNKWKREPSSSLPLSAFRLLSTLFGGKRKELRHSKNRIGGGETWIFDLPIVTPRRFAYCAGERNKNREKSWLAPHRSFPFQNRGKFDISKRR